MEPNIRIDKDIFKQIFRDNWGNFRRKYPRYSSVYYDEVIKKMLFCGDVVSGYSIYRCINCGLEEKK
jgi:hypothetical protein